ncbi:MAG: glycosyltransferase family 4 protein [Tepidisphaeraceae bacterium]
MTLRPRILMYTPTPCGGHALFTRELLHALVDLGGSRYRFELVTSTDLAPAYATDAYPIHAILPPIHPRSAYPTPLHWACGRLRYYSRREMGFASWVKAQDDVALVHFQEWGPGVAVPMLRTLRSIGVKTLRTVHNITLHHYDWWQPRGVVARALARERLACDGLAVLSEQLQVELSRSLGEPHPPIFVTRHGAWTGRRVAAHRPLRDRMAAKRLLFFGALRENKGLDLLLQAMDLLPGYSLTIAGEPTEPAFFHQRVLPQVERLRAKGYAIDLLADYLSESQVDALFAQTSAAVLPYAKTFTAQSGVVFMALAHRVPVIASDVAGLGDILGEFGIGTTFHTRLPAALAEAVRRLFEQTNPDDLGDQIADARRSYSWSNSAAATLHAYDTLLGIRKEHDGSAIESIAIR